MALPNLGRLLVLNAGSSSLKFKLFDTAAPGLAAGVGGLIERIGDVAAASLVAKDASGPDGPRKWSQQVPVKDHVDALQTILAFLRQHVSGAIESEVTAVGHRVVHGLDIHSAVLLSDQVVAKIRDAAALAPLHNPPGLAGIAAAQQVFKGVPQVRATSRPGAREPAHVCAAQQPFQHHACAGCHRPPGGCV